MFNVPWWRAIHRAVLGGIALWDFYATVFTDMGAARAFLTSMAIMLCWLVALIFVTFIVCAVNVYRHRGEA